MVKADPKHDYYADLELPPSADTETIKKQFRLLAKQYHPDRNPGKEIEVVPKFQAVQAANEILSDANQKAKYDADRAKINSKKIDIDTYAFKRPPPPKATHGATFNGTPRRNASTERGQFERGTGRPPSATSAEKFATFARSAPQQWDRAKFDDAATRAEALRNLQSMRGQGPPKPPRAPTAPKPGSTAPSPDSYTGAPPGFQGMNRAYGTRKGFAPGTPTGDDPSAIPRSAYAHVHRDRPPPPSAGYSYAQPQSGASSPPTSRSRPSMSPLRNSRSTGFEEARPGFERTSSRYAGSSGERTDINGTGLNRSSSVRDAPSERGAFGHRAQAYNEFKVPQPRHHSASPQLRPQAKFEISPSDSSSSEDEPKQAENRPKAMPRKPRAPTAKQTSENGPALTGQFPKTNYSNHVEEAQYRYPPPPEHRAPSQKKPFESARNSVEDITEGLNSAGIRHVHKDDVERPNQPPRHPNGATSESAPSSANPNSTFSASEWDGKFANGDAFRPTDAPSRSKSPTKSTRLRPTARNVTRGGGAEEEATAEENSPTRPGARHAVSDQGSKASAFQPGKFSAEDWAARLRSQSDVSTPSKRSQTSTPKPASKQPEVQDEQDIPTVEVQPPPNTTAAQSNAEPTPDAMDIDEALPVPQANGNVHKTRSRGSSSPGSRRPSSGGTTLTLEELRETAPLRPTPDGLKNLDGLAQTLPFESRAAEELNLRQPPSSSAAARHLNLPKPPKPVSPPGEDNLSQDAWSLYSQKISQYMHDWNVFNCKMIDHFRLRQEQVNLSMYHNWVTAVGDGAPADEFDGLDIIGGTLDSNGKTKKAGYATYMEWLEQDHICRTWWDVAFEEHRECLEGLGKVRKCVKDIRKRELGGRGRKEEV